MLINSINLTNIGPYRGINKIDFKVNNKEKRNTILIGGQNGAGKTTLLNSFKLGLFGSFAFGYKTDNNEYFNKVESMLNNQAKKFGENNYKIVIDIEIVEDFKKKHYTLYRYWKYKNNSIKEIFDVVGNGKHLDEYEKDVFHSKLKELMPPHLLDLCLFDGEEISKIINQNLLSDYIKKLSKVVFNLDLFETLEFDLESYLQQTFDTKKLSEKELEILDKRTQAKELNNRLLTLYNEKSNVELQKKALEEEYQNLKKDFEIHGGLVRNERDEINKKINTLESERKITQEKIRIFVANLLPFLISKENISQTRKQLSEEENFQLFSKLEKSLTNEKLNGIASFIELTDTNKINALKEKILETVKPTEEMYFIHGASFSESAQIENVYSQLQQPLNDEYLELISSNKSKLTEISGLREKLKISDNSSEFNEMLNRMEELNQLVAKVSLNLDDLDKSSSEVETKLKEVSTVIESYDSKIREQEKTKNAFEESQKIISLSQKFRKLQIQKKLQQVQIQATNMLKSMLRKHNYIYSIRIDPETFDVLLFDENRERIEKSTLSAGEKQILLLSIIWAIFKCSGRRVPFIFDTLLGRLDKIHKESILKELIPVCGEQVIILSTDTEIDQHHYEIITSHLAKEYTLLFNVTDKTTSVEDHYFSLNSTELSI
ncbi:DNA sulfur modification protein DndD [Bacillus sp. Y1]|nr:DNA sulfur modification protein DndD [Bacillus sp. Y1]AYA76007.1 DNA sulfur modification protein DndD [Bacillus sp. Y1]